MVSLGTSSDRIGTPPGTRSTYLTFAKSLPGDRVAPYFSVNYSSHDREINFPFGVNLAISPNWDLLGMNDGRKSHAILTFSRQSYSVSLIWVWLRHPGVAMSVGF